jgi:hypothetical protein
MLPPFFFFQKPARRRRGGTNQRARARPSVDQSAQANALSPSIPPGREYAQQQVGFLFARLIPSTRARARFAQADCATVEREGETGGTSCRDAAVVGPRRGAPRYRASAAHGLHPHPCDAFARPARPRAEREAAAVRASKQKNKRATRESRLTLRPTNPRARLLARARLLGAARRPDESRIGAAASAYRARSDAPRGSPASRFVRAGADRHPAPLNRTRGARQATSSWSPPFLDAPPRSPARRPSAPTPAPRPPPDPRDRAPDQSHQPHNTHTRTD